jgi:hypothetical protein
MTISNFRASEALYIVIVREKDAEQLLKNWAKSANAQVTIESNRMKIFEERSLSLFRMHWAHGYENVTVWDAWNKRHIYLD